MNSALLFTGLLGWLRRFSALMEMRQRERLKVMNWPARSSHPVGDRRARDAGKRCFDFGSGESGDVVLESHEPGVFRTENETQCGNWIDEPSAMRKGSGMKEPASDAKVLIQIGSGDIAGMLLKGPRSAADVAKLGYAFTWDRDQAWPFPSQKAAAAKSRIVNLHMGWGDVCLVQNDQGMARRESGPPQQ